MYTETGLGIAPAAISIGVAIGQKIAKLLGGHLTANVQRIAGQISDNYQAALNGDAGALEWLYTKSGGHDTDNKLKVLENGSGWRISDVGGGLQVGVIYASGLRRATYEYYTDAAAKTRVPIQKAGIGAEWFRLNNISTPTYAATNKTPLMTIAPPQAQPEPQRSQASLFGMDFSNPMTTLAPLGLIALAFVFRERE